MKLPLGIRLRKVALDRSGDRYLLDVTVNKRRFTRTVTGTLDEAKAARLALEIEARATVSADERGWTVQKAFEETTAMVWRGQKDASGSIRNGDMLHDCNDIPPGVQSLMPPISEAQRTAE